MFLNQIPDNFKLTPESQHETPLVKEHFFPFSTRRCLIQQEDVKNDALKLRRRSERQAASVWINLISDFRFGQHENPNDLDCPNPKKVWLKRIQPHESQLVNIEKQNLIATLIFYANTVSSKELHTDCKQGCKTAKRQIRRLKRTT